MDNPHALTEEEARHLHDLAFGGLMQKRLPDHVRSSLLDRGLIDMRVGGEVIVGNGYNALKSHKGSHR